MVTEIPVKIQDFHEFSEISKMFGDDSGSIQGTSLMPRNEFTLIIGPPLAQISKLLDFGIFLEILLVTEFWSNFKIFMNFRDSRNCLGWTGIAQ